MMVSRVVFLFITIFWMTMNVLLWRSEFGGQNAVGSTVPAAMVWQKILTAPDNSSLEVSHRGKKIGFCRWAATVGEEAMSSRVASDDGPPEEMIERVTGYRIDFEGNIGLKDFVSRLRFNLSAAFTTNHTWQEFHANFNLRPLTVDLRSVASEQTLHLRTEDETGRTERIFKFSDLQNPQVLLQGFQNLLPLALPNLTGLTANSKNPPPAEGLKWDARNDWFQIGHTSVHAYRLQTKILDRYPVKIVISRVGEILRVELPDEIVLANDQLTTW